MPGGSERRGHGLREPVGGEGRVRHRRLFLERGLQRGGPLVGCAADPGEEPCRVGGELQALRPDGAVNGVDLGVEEAPKRAAASARVEEMSVRGLPGVAAANAADASSAGRELADGPGSER